MDTPILDDELKDFAHRVIVAISCFANEIDEKGIEDFVDFFANKEKIHLTPTRRTAVLRKVEASVCHNRPYDYSVFSEKYQPWFDAFWKANPDSHYYWDCYRTFLLTNPEMHLQHVISMDKITSAIVDHLENPRKPGPWSRRGMMVGQVQSGKTGTYIGVAAKAADCGYRFIVIMAGTLNTLRSQTQGRVEEGLIGRSTADKHNGESVGVGLVSGANPEKKPSCFTTRKYDFQKTAANTTGLAVGGTFEPIILVIKKNASTLANLIEWIRTNTSAKALKDLPFLLIDDEADYASINVRKPEDDPTKINGQIRDLLNLFGRNSYLGCTATPFANIFIDPDANSDVHGKDLFPRDFILTLDAPDTYMGPEVFFGGEGQNLIRLITDVSAKEGCLPVLHKKGFVVSDLPESMVDALHVFVLAKTIRMLRGEKNFHCSALVNASRFKDVHAQLTDKVQDIMDRICNAVDTYAAMDEKTALADSTIARLKQLFDKEYATVVAPTISWEHVQGRLADAVLPKIEVLTVNSDATARNLDYSKENWPHGRTVVVVGGMSLSRGLTLEGLTVSYYLRNSIAYDTLMQMGRWFGYRPGYGDLCRVYMTELCKDWYVFITTALSELNADFHAMNAFDLTPKDFGLRVKAHPGAMLVTARNKMRTSQHVTIQLNYYASLVETTKLSINPADNQANRNNLQKWLLSLGPGSKADAAPENGWLWHDVPAESITAFCEGFKAYPLAILDKIRPVCEYIRKMKTCAKWDVFLASRTRREGPADTPFRIADMDILPIRRSMEWGAAEKHAPEAFIRVNGDNLRVADARAERAGLFLSMTKEELESAEKGFLKNHKAVSGNLYRENREQYGANPLFIVHIVSANNENLPPEDEVSLHNLVALTWSFPGNSRQAGKAPTEEYEVNRVWYENYLEELGAGTDEYDDDEETT